MRTGVIFRHSYNPVKMRKDMRIGDIEIVNPMPWDVIIDPQINTKTLIGFIG